MFINRLQLENFRNYGKVELNFTKDRPMTVFVGKNAQGKTNLLESIYVLALTKSFRSHKPVDLLTWEREHGRIKATIEKQDEKEEMEIFVSRADSRKFLKVKNQTVTASNYVGRVSVVIFTPEDLNMVLLEPELRRKYLNHILAQIDKRYLVNLVNYNKSVKQRNSLLRFSEGIVNPAELDVWDERLIEFGKPILDKRTKLIDKFNKKLTKKYREIAGTKDELQIRYLPGAQDLAEDLQAAREKDLRARTTSVGPHRDDFEIILNDLPIASTGSRGEIRSAVLAMKLIELEIFEAELKLKPILLLDDVFSELDHQRQRHLINATLNHQTFITTTCKEHLGDLTDKVNIYKIDDGTLTPVH